MCTKYDIQREAGEVDSKLQREYDEHLKRKDAARESKEADQKKANKESTYHTATFDLEVARTTPCTLVNQLYYKRKLNVHNLSVYSLGNQRDVCYLWNETNGKRGSCEIGTRLYLYICSLGPPINHVCLCSDRYAGQNRDKCMAMALLHAVKTSSIEVIDHKFLQTGHTNMECDSMHSAIEFAKKNILPSQPMEHCQC